MLDSPPPQPQFAAPSEEPAKPWFARKRVLIPAGLLAFAVAAGSLIDPDSPEAPADIATQSAAPAIVIPTTPTTPTTAVETSTTDASSTTTTESEPIPEALALVSEKDLVAAQAQLEGAELVPAFAESPKYVRDSYTGGGWPDSDGDCQSDRHEILIEESLVEVVLDDAGCRVESGRWIDAFDGTEYTDAQQVTIDHMVPLAAAHRAGAWRWDDASKRAFASDISFAATHIAVGGEVNQAKGDKGPEEWRPSLESSWCAYAVDWISIKARWELDMTEAEADALNEMLDTCEAVSGINAIAGNVLPVAPTITTTTSSTTTTVSTTTTAAVAAATASNCHPNYDPCVPNVAGDLNCKDIGFSVRIVGGRDPYELDGDDDGRGCESY